MSNATIGHILQIDSLRAVAIGTVVLNHALAGRNLPFLGYPVCFFFVLSGYFAARGLLSRKWHALGADSFLGTVANYWKRRWLRILPLYYFVLLVSLLAALPGAKEFFISNLTLTTNFVMLRSGEWAGVFSPIWSLAALEQVLFLLPLVILGARRRYLPELLGMAIVVGLSFRVFCAWFDLSMFWWFLPPIACLDQICVGALLAVLRSQSRPLPPNLGKISGITLILIISVNAMGNPLPYAAVYAPTVSSIFFACLIQRVHEPITGWLGKLLHLPLVAFAGKTTYSVFLTHGFIVFYFPIALEASPIQVALSALFILVSSFVLGGIVHRFVERPLASVVAARVPLGILVRNQGKLNHTKP